MDRGEGWRTFLVWGVPLYVHARRRSERDGGELLRVLIHYGDDARFSSLRHSRAGTTGTNRTARETIKSAFDDLRERIAMERCRHFAGLR